MDDIDYVVLSDISEINPPTDMHRLDDNTFVSFIPMADVSESGEWINQQTRLLKDVRNRYTYFQEGDILFAKITPCMENGKGAHAVNLLNGIGFGTTEFHVLRAKSCAHPRFIYHWIMNEELRRKAEARMTGSAGQRRVPASFFGEFKVPFLPLSEQRRIAEILDTIDEAIQKTEELISKLKAMKQGLLHDLLTRGLDKNGKLRDPKAHPEQFKDSPLGKIPKEWRINRLSHICELLNGLAFKPSDWSFTGIPIIRIQNLNQGTEFNYFNGVVQDKYVIPPDTLLFSWSGNRETSFGPFIWSGPTGVLNQHIFKVTPREGFRLHWFYYSLDIVRQRVERAAHGGSGLVHIKRSDLTSYLVATPDKEEQKRIEETISSHDSRIRIEEQYRDKLKLQKKGLIHDLLTGKVRVKV